MGVQLAGDYAAHVVTAAQHAGFIINMTGPSRLRFAPPLVLTEDDTRAFADAWAGILAQAQAQAQAHSQGQA